MKLRGLFFGAICLLLTSAVIAGPILSERDRLPSNLVTIFRDSPVTKTVQNFTSIACYNAFDGDFLDCAFDFTINSLATPNIDVNNNGGHNHDFPTHPRGALQIIVPNLGPQLQSVKGQTRKDLVVVSHKIPEVSGVFNTTLNLFVPPGWTTVSPESLDNTRKSWRFITTLRVGYNGMVSLPGGSVSYVKVRGPDTRHPDSVAFYGTPDAQTYLSAIADTYLLLKDRSLSLNDMSLPVGGLFDANGGYLRPHSLHRVGTSVDINTTDGDCLKNRLGGVRRW